MNRMRGSLLIAALFLAGVASCSLLVDTGGLAGDGAGGGGGSSDASTSSADATPSSDGSTAGDGAPATCADAGSDPSLVLYLPLDETAGTTAFDCSGHGNDGHLVGAATPTRAAGHTGGALVFDGAETCLSLGNPSDLVPKGAFTIAAWIRVDEYQTSPPANDSREIFARTTDATHLGWRFTTDGIDTTAVFALKVGAPATAISVTSPPAQPLSTWMHVAAVWSPSDGTSTVYVRGAAVGTKSALPAIVDDPTAIAYVGCTKPGSQVLKAALDELRLYTRALAPTEIAALAR